LRLGGDLFGGDLLGRDRLGDFLLGDLTLTECRGDLKREGRGLSPLLLGVGEGDRLGLTDERARSRSGKRQFCSSINDVCR